MNTTSPVPACLTFCLVTIQLFTAGNAPAQEPVCVTPPPGIVAWWRAESNTLDSVGFNDGIYNVNYTTGKAGSGWLLGQSYVRVITTPELDLGTGAGFTIEGWIKPDRLNWTLTPIAEWNDWFGAGVSLDVIFSSAPGILEASLGTNDIYFYQTTLRSAPGLVKTSIWQHVALTFDHASGDALLYYNGSVVARTNVGTSFVPFTSSDFFMGFRQGGRYALSGFSGAMDEMALYNRALAPAEIQSIFNADYAGKCPPSPPVCLEPLPGIVGWWRGESNTLDIVNGNNAQASNALTYTTGEVGSAFNLRGSYLHVPASSNLDVGTGPGLTVEFWVNDDDIIAQPFVDWNSGTGTQGVYVAYNFYGVSLDANLIDINGQPHLLQSLLNTTTEAINFWQHIVVTYDKASGAGALYRNGICLVHTNLGSFTPRTSTDLYFGYSPPSPYFGSTFGVGNAGRIDEISIYNRALAPSEIQSILLSRGLGKCAQPPTIVSQPADVDANLGGTALFNVSAAGTPVLHYQWFFNGTAISNATDATLAVAPVTAANTGAYSVTVSNMLGTVFSSNVVLNIIPTADASATKSSVISCDGTDALVVLDGSRSSDPDSDPLQFTWREGSNALASGMVAIATLPIGVHSITLTVSDGNASSIQPIQVRVITTTQALLELIHTVNGAVPNSQPFIASLKAAAGSIARGNSIAAINQLRAFQNKVAAQLGSSDLSQQLILSAEDIINALGCAGG